MVKNLDFSNLPSSFTLPSSLLLAVPVPVPVVVLSSLPEESLMLDVVREIEVPLPDMLEPEMLD